MNSQSECEADNNSGNNSGVISVIHFDNNSCETRMCRRLTIDNIIIVMPAAAGELFIRLTIDDASV
jgi:hypothetical protein